MKEADSARAEEPHRDEAVRDPEASADTEADDTNDGFDQRLDQVGHSFVGTHFVGTP